MEFGRLTSLDGVDLSLPRTDDATLPLLARDRAGDRARESAALRVGTAGWSDPGYVGVLYPEGTRRADFLARYAARFPTVELNSTYYGIDAERIAQWAGAVPEGFVFHPKLPRVVSHDRALVDVEREMEGALAAFARFGPSMGRAWATLAPSFGPRMFPALARFVETFAPRVRLALKLRHEGWFVDGPARHDVFALFEAHGVAAMLTDTPGRRDVLHMRLTAPEIYLRFVGNALHPTDFKRLDAWAARIGEWCGAGLASADLFMHQKSEPQAVALAEHLERALGLEPWQGAPARQLDLF